MRRYIYISLVAGILTPILVMVVLVPKAVPTMIHQLARGNTRDILMVLVMQVILPLIPFVALIAATSGVRARRQGCAFWGGFIGVWGFTVWGHVSAWYPLWVGKRGSSTAAIAFLFIPFYALVPLVVGLLIGWGVSFLPSWNGGKNKPPAREEGEDDKFSF